MIIVFQIFAVALVAVAAFFIFRSGGARQQAIRRIFLLLFIAGVALSVFFPQVLTWVANLFGIGRGTDLIVYLVTIAFIGFVATTYRRFRHMEKDQTLLARQLALLTAQSPDASRGPTGIVPHEDDPRASSAKVEKPPRPDST